MSDTGAVMNSALRVQLLRESLIQVPMKVNETVPVSGMAAAQDCHIKRSKSCLETGARIEATRVCPLSDPDVVMDSVVREPMQSESGEHVSSEKEMGAQDCHIKRS